MGKKENLVKYSSPLERTLFLFLIFEKTQVISLYWFAAHHQTITSRWQKLDSIYPKFSAEFNLVSGSKNDTKWQKLTKTKTVQKTTNMWHSGPKG